MTQRENWAVGGRTDVWVPEEDPEVAIVRIAHALSTWFREQNMVGASTDYNFIYKALRNFYEMSKEEDIEDTLEEMGDFIRREYEKAMRLIRLCCNGSDPEAAIVWIVMTPHLKKYDESGRWIMENIRPISLRCDPGGGQVIFGLNTTWQRAKGWQKHMWALRIAFATALPSQMFSDIEVWDRDFSVWAESVKAA